MRPSSQPVLSPDRSLDRVDFYMVLRAACEVNEWRYARRLCTAWLATFPGDLAVKFQYALAIAQDENLNSPHQALAILEELCALDPEYAQAQALLSSLRKGDDQASHDVSKGCVLALSSHTAQLANKGEMTPIWARQLYEARTSLTKFLSGDLNSLEKAEHAIHQALVENPETPLAAVTHLNVMAVKIELPSSAVLSLAQIYHTRWPDCLQFSLILADRLMDSGESAQAVELLHQVVTKDITGQVIKRLWGADHPYHTLWPDRIEIAPSSLTSPQNIPVPAMVAGRLGWNQLPPKATAMSTPTLPPADSSTAEKLTSPTFTSSPAIVAPAPNQVEAKSIKVPRRRKGMRLSESARSVQSEFANLARQLKTPVPDELEGRFPVYVILSTRTGLEKQYGAQGAARLDEELKKLARAIRGQRIDRQTWGAILIYADDPEYTSFFELPPVPYNDAWALKLLLADVDAALGKGGEKIGAILLVGGPDVVPFHHLPNPVDDADTDVLSDNPYASIGENYFVPEWSIGRLPGSSAKDPADLLAAIKSITRRHLERQKFQPWYLQLWSHLSSLIRQTSGHLQSSFGYTAAVWRRASLAVYRTIGNPQELLISPPVRSCDLEMNGTPLTPGSEVQPEHTSCLILPGTKLAYFNLHGISDSAFWYGQRDPSEPLPGLEFPVAIRPQDIRNGGSAPKLVFSEACYGAHILGKSIEEALSLKFLASGSQAVIGSTCISYGSISTPLSAADLLGRIFWGLLEEGFQAGEALRRAKLHLVREMHRRQGYLDPEDQKTIISFQCYGDPLAQPYHPQRKSKGLNRNSELPAEIQTISENPQTSDHRPILSPEMISHVKSIVAQYLPGMTDAQLQLTQAQIEHTGLMPVENGTTDHSSNTSSHLTSRQVVTLSKSIQQASFNHQQYARLTMDESGKLLKLTVSR